MTEHLLSVDHLDVRVDGKIILDDVSLRVDPGEIITIVGPNGSGKSTLLRTIIGVTPPNGGKVTRRPGLKVGYVPQKLRIDDTLPVTVRRFLDMPRPVGGARAAQMLERVGAGEIAQQQLSDLSGGQLQRVLLARALLENPDLLILDEATQGLDQQGSAVFYALLDDIRADTGCAVLMVSHELHVVMAASDRVICLNGHVCCHGTPEIVASAPEYRALFGRGTKGALALYRHEHNHTHDATCDHTH